MEASFSSKVSSAAVAPIEKKRDDGRRRCAVGAAEKKTKTQPRPHLTSSFLPSFSLSPSHTGLRPHWPRRARCRPLRSRPRHYPRRSAPQAGHDPRRPVQHQRGHRARPRRRRRGTCAQGRGQHYFQSRQLYCADRGRGAQGRGRVRPEEAARCDDARRRPRQHVRGGEIVFLPPFHFLPLLPLLRLCCSMFLSSFTAFLLFSCSFFLSFFPISLNSSRKTKS